MPAPFTRREFLASSVALLSASACRSISTAAAEPIIDIHQHTHYHNRTDADLIAHQRTMGVTQTILLPAGSVVDCASTNHGKANGLAAQCSGNQSVMEFARRLPAEYLFAANEVSDLPQACAEIEKYIKLGAICIGEQKFHLDLDSAAMDKIAGLAQDYNVPVLIHVEERTYFSALDRFHKTLEKYPRVNFIGHAVSWWANIDKNYDLTKGSYPKGKVTRGGITDRLLSDYPNMYGDMSAGSGLNALTRDEEHGRGFIKRHQDKLLYGSDCADSLGAGEKCSGSQMIAAIRRLSPGKAVERKLLYENAKRLFKL
jgi:predicted TIM-barrel fold metal-dependent hydrolase